MGWVPFRRVVLGDRHPVLRTSAFFALVVAGLNWSVLAHLRTHVVGGPRSDVFEGLSAPYPEFTAVAVNERPVDEWLASQTERVAVIEYPLPEVNVLALYAQMHHRQKLANGYMFIDPTHWAMVRGPLGHWPTEATVPVLRQWGIDYVIVNARANEGFERDVLEKIRRVRGLEKIGSFGRSFEGFGTVEVYRVLRG